MVWLFPLNELTSLLDLTKLGTNLTLLNFTWSYLELTCCWLDLTSLGLDFLTWLCFFVPLHDNFMTLLDFSLTWNRLTWHCLFKIWIVLDLTRRVTELTWVVLETTWFTTYLIYFELCLTFPDVTFHVSNFFAFFPSWIHLFESVIRNILQFSWNT